MNTGSQRTICPKWSLIQILTETETETDMPSLHALRGDDRVTAPAAVTTVEVETEPKMLDLVFWCIVILFISFYLAYSFYKNITHRGQTANDGHRRSIFPIENNVTQTILPPWGRPPPSCKIAEIVLRRVARNL